MSASPKMFVEAKTLTIMAEYFNSIKPGLRKCKKVRALYYERRRVMRRLLSNAGRGVFYYIHDNSKLKGVDTKFDESGFYYPFLNGGYTLERTNDTHYRISWPSAPLPVSDAPKTTKTPIVITPENDTTKSPNEPTRKRLIRLLAGMFPRDGKGYDNVCISFRSRSHLDYIIRAFPDYGNLSIKENIKKEQQDHDAEISMNESACTDMVITPTGTIQKLDDLNFKDRQWVVWDISNFLSTPKKSKTKSESTTTAEIKAEGITVVDLDKVTKQPLKLDEDTEQLKKASSVDFVEAQIRDVFSRVHEIHFNDLLVAMAIDYTKQKSTICVPFMSKASAELFCDEVIRNIYSIDIKKRFINIRDEVSPTSAPFDYEHGCLIFMDGTYEMGERVDMYKKDKNTLIIPYMNVRFTKTGKTYEYDKASATFKKRHDAALAKAIKGVTKEKALLTALVARADKNPVTPPILSETVDAVEEEQSTKDRKKDA